MQNTTIEPLFAEAEAKGWEGHMDINREGESILVGIEDSTLEMQVEFGDETYGDPASTVTMWNDENYVEIPATLLAELPTPEQAWNIIGGG